MKHIAIGLLKAAKGIAWAGELVTFRDARSPQIGSMFEYRLEATSQTALVRGCLTFQ